MEINLAALDLKTRNRVDEIFRNDFDLKVLQAMRRQTAVAARNHLHRPKSRDGFGGKSFEIDAVIDGIWRQVYGHNYTEDRDVMRFLLKRNPEIGCKATGTKMQVGYQASGTRFSKRYDWKRT